MPTNIVETLKNAGLRVTAPRVKILAIFEEGKDRHLSAEDVYHQLSNRSEGIGLATVYRVLAQLEEAGILVRRSIDNSRAVFELTRFGAHNHVVCLDCGKLTCFVDEDLDRLQREIAGRCGGELVNYSLHSYVRCTDLNCGNRKVAAKNTSAESRPSNPTQHTHHTILI